MSEKTAKDMRWHDMGLTKDGKLRHPADGLAWKAFDTWYPKFASDPRSVRLGLARDGFNPFRTMRGKALGDDINIYLIPLIKELKLSWKGLDAYDAFSKELFKLRASLLWTVNDFPAYANLSGWSTKGHVACPLRGTTFKYGKYDKSFKKRTRDATECLDDKCSAFGDKDDLIEEEIDGKQQL
nr:hypothetical protein [Tanacetum cinerariifolium]